MRRLLLMIAMAVMVPTWPALACGPQVHVQFAEASPDRFRITFRHGPKLSLASLKIRLDGSAAGVIFDHYEGLEQQGPQPTPNGVAMRSVTYDVKGETSVTLTFEGFLEKRWIDFYSDLDDMIRAADQDGDHVYDGELAGATATATLIGENGRIVQIDGTFDAKSQAVLAEKACV